MNKIVTISAIIALLAVSRFAETHLIDDIGGKTFEASGNPYIVDKDVVIPQNTQVTVKQGCVFLFKSFTGMNVFGSLVVEGTVQSPIVFTSINDANYNTAAEQLPNAFDWNGIYIAETAGAVKLRNFKLMFSVFGIKAKKDDIVIQNGDFKQNGQFHFTINDNIHFVQDNISYSYNAEKEQERVEKPVEDKRPAPEKEEKKDMTGAAKKRRVAAVTLLGVGSASLISTIITGIVASNNFEKAETVPGKYEFYDNKFQAARTITVITGIVSGVTLPVSLFLFVKKDKSTMTQKISVNVEGGIDRVGLNVRAGF